MHGLQVSQRDRKFLCSWQWSHMVMDEAHAVRPYLHLLSQTAGSLCSSSSSGSSSRRQQS